MEKDNAIILILLILIAIASCVCIIISGTNVSLVQPHETNTSTIANITNNTTLDNSNVTVDNTERDTGIYAPDSDGSSDGGNYYTGQTYQYQGSYDSGQSSQSSDSGQGSQSTDSGQGSQSSDSGSETPAVDPGQSDQPAEVSDAE